MNFGKVNILNMTLKGYSTFKSKKGVFNPIWTFLNLV